MINIRYGCFETNSSSTHSLIIANDEEYKKLVNGELYIKYGDFYTKDELIDELIEYYSDTMSAFCIQELKIENPECTRKWFSKLTPDVFNKLVYEFCDGVQTYEDYMDDEFLENFDEEYVSEHGDHIHIFGKFGRDS